MHWKHFIMAIIAFMVTGPMLLAQEEAQKVFSEGVRQLKANEFVEAEHSFTRAIEMGEAEDGLKMAHIYKGFALNGQGRYTEAITCFDRAIEIDPKDPASYTDRGQAYAYMKEYDKAIEDFNSVLVLDPIGDQAQAAFYYLGRIKMLIGKDEEAIGHFDRLLELVPTDAEGYFLRGTAKANLMEIDGSIADFDQAIHFRPDYMEAYANRGVQKVNKVPVGKRTGGRVDCLKDPCADLLKARSMGDTTVEDMIFLYCSKCK